jgi:hypothetical protein
MAITEVNKGDKYCIVTAVAKGIFCKVKTNKLNAINPEIPLKIKFLELLPFRDI